MQQYGATEEQAAKVRVKAAKNALKNPHAHLRLSLTEQDVLNSRLLAYPIRLLDMCPTSNGACALILASEERAKKITRKPVWIVDTATCHNEGYFGAVREGPTSLETAARKLYQRNGITHPRRELNLIELYEPSTWAELIWYEYLFLCERGEGGKLIDQGLTDLEGEIPVNPSGGVLSTNPIGATAMIRIAEAALQIRGDAGERQVAKAERALATAFGGSFWTVLTLLQKKLP
jgi:acetyl-CoA C-acetyltransferase